MRLNEKLKCSTLCTILVVIIVKIIFIRSFLFYCLLCNHSFKSNPNTVTNLSKLFNYIAPASLFDTFKGEEIYGTLRSTFNISLPNAWESKCLHYMNQCLEVDVRMTPGSLTSTTPDTASHASNTTGWATTTTSKRSLPLILVSGYVEMYFSKFKYLTVLRI